VSTSHIDAQDVVLAINSQLRKADHKLHTAFATSSELAGYQAEHQDRVLKCDPYVYLSSFRPNDTAAAPSCH